MNPQNCNLPSSPDLYREYRDRGTHGALFHGDVLDFLKAIESGSASIVFLDPPFNLGKRYHESFELDCHKDTNYELWIAKILEESIRILTNGGALYLYHLPKWAFVFANKLSGPMQFRHWIAVSMKNNFVRGNWLYPAHYALLYFTKGNPKVFVRPKTEPRRCRHCGELIKDYGGYRKIIEQKGINLSDVWDDISPVRHRSSKTRKSNELPRVFLDRVLEISGDPGGLFIDPFAGSGTGVISAARAGMHFLACDIVEQNCALIDSRVKSASTAG